MSKHALGPWSYGHPAQHEWTIRDNNGSLIATYHGANSDDNPQNEATARLIAAAPDLLAACELARLLPGYSDPRAARLRALIDTAIAIAKGGAP